MIDLAVREGRVLLTEDKDFGQLVYAELRSSSGVILVRFPATHREDLPQFVLDAVEQIGERLTGAFVVLTPQKIRIGRDPRS